MKDPSPVQPQVCGGIDPEWLARVIAEADAETWARWIAEPHAHAQECAEKLHCGDCLACYVEDMRDAAAEALGTLLAVSCCEHGPTVTVTWTSGDECPLCQSYEAERRLRVALTALINAVEDALDVQANSDAEPPWNETDFAGYVADAKAALEET